MLRDPVRGAHRTLTPEVEERIRLDGRELRLLRPRSAEALLDTDADDAPYWAELWPSARALAAYVSTLDLRGSRVLDLGAGLGLTSLAAAAAGADVLAVDHAREAVALIARSAKHNRLRVRTMCADLKAPPAELLEADPFDLVLASDVLYEASLAAAVDALLRRLVGGHALVTYPWARQADGVAATGTADGWVVEHGELTCTHHGREHRVRLLRLDRPAP